MSELVPSECSIPIKAVKIKGVLDRGRDILQILA